MLKKVKIRGKLIAGFISVAFLVGLVGYVGISGIQKEKSSLIEIADVRLPGIQSILVILEGKSGVWVAERGLINAGMMDPVIRKAQYDYIKERFTEIEVAWKSYETLIHSKEEKAEWDIFVPLWEKWKYDHEQVVKISMQHDELVNTGLSLDNYKVKELFNKAFEASLVSRQSSLEAEKVLRKIVDINLKLSATSKENALNTAKSSLIMMVIFMVAGVLLAIILGLLIANNILSIIKAVIAQTKQLVNAAVSGNLSTRANAAETNEEFREIVVGINQTLDAVIKPLNVAANYVDRISKGDIPAKITDTYNGDFNDIKNNLNTCIDALDTLIGEMNNMSKQHDLGDIDVAINTGKFEGAYKNMAQGVNDMVFAHISVKKRAMGIFTQFGEGNFEAEMELLPGKKRFINETIESVRGNLKSLIADANMLAEAAVQGKLATRADASRHKGDFRKIVQGVNETLDAVIGPLNVAARYIDRISKGDNPELITDNYNGDFNTIKDNLNVLVKSNIEIIEKAKLVAAGDLTVDLKKRSDKDELMQSLTEMVKSTANIISEFKSASDNISASSQQMSSTSQEMSQGASEQASSAEEVSSSMEEMAANIQQNTENAQQTEKIALNAAEGINKVNVASDQTLKYMQDIADKVSIIGEIARQTNILALNAAVEAARAGEHGKGFAVVAAEVRKLAERSQISAVEIDTLTKNSVRATEESVKLLAAIAPEIGKTAKLVQEIAAASIEQNSGADQVNNAIQQLNQVTQQNAAASEEMATSSEELASQAQQLLEMIAFFKIENNSARSRSMNERPAMAHASVAHVAHIDKPTVKHAESAKKPLKGVSLNMGKDSLDSNYEKF